ncbi:hypothetical protein MHU86_17460 [Fragilaria crotonensis]|nr:hypothetical protein MHU86_17460 [Fragilaria crotonensis]
MHSLEAAGSPFQATDINSRSDWTATSSLRVYLRNPPYHRSVSMLGRNNYPEHDVLAFNPLGNAFLPSGLISTFLDFFMSMPPNSLKTKFHVLKVSVLACFASHIAKYVASSRKVTSLAMPNVDKESKNWSLRSEFRIKKPHSNYVDFRKQKTSKQSPRSLETSGQRTLGWVSYV